VVVVLNLKMWTREPVLPASMTTAYRSFPLPSPPAVGTRDVGRRNVAARNRATARTTSLAKVVDVVLVFFAAIPPNSCEPAFPPYAFIMPLLLPFSVAFLARKRRSTIRRVDQAAPSLGLWMSDPEGITSTVCSQYSIGQCSRLLAAIPKELKVDLSWAQEV